MTVSQKQLEANRRNAKKGGIKTAEGKAIAKFNALKHGLLAREAVVTVGEGAEDLAEFEALSQDLKNQLQPDGTLEKMLVEKITVAYWRLRRAHRYEVGLIRRELDTATDNFYNQTKWDGAKSNKSEAEIDLQIEQAKEGIAHWQKDKRELAKMRKAGTPLEDIYDWDENWDGLSDRTDSLVPEYFEWDEDHWPKQLREFLTGQAGWSDDDIWKALIHDCDGRVEQHRKPVRRGHEGDRGGVSGPDEVAYPRGPVDMRDAIIC